MDDAHFCNDLILLVVIMLNPVTNTNTKWIYKNLVLKNGRHCFHAFLNQTNLDCAQSLSTFLSLSVPVAIIRSTCIYFNFDIGFWSHLIVSITLPNRKRIYFLCWRIIIIYNFQWPSFRFGYLVSCFYCFGRNEKQFASFWLLGWKCASAPEIETQFKFVDRFKWSFRVHSCRKLLLAQNIIKSMN